MKNILWLLIAIIFTISCGDDREFERIKKIKNYIDTTEYILEDRLESFDIDSAMQMSEDGSTKTIPYKNLSVEEFLYLQEVMKDSTGYFGKDFYGIQAQKKTKYYFIHCTATPQGRGIDARWLLDFFYSPKPRGRGWSRPGYSGVIVENGELQKLREYNFDGHTSYEEITYGVAGVNSVSLHFALVGGVDKNLKTQFNYTDAQLQTLALLIDKILCSDPDATILGHRDYPGVSKSCPAFDIRKHFNL